MAESDLLQVPGDKPARDAAERLNRTDRHELTGAAAAAAHAVGRALHRRYYVDGHQVGTFLADLAEAGYRLVEVDDSSRDKTAAAAVTPTPRRPAKSVRTGPGRTAAKATAG